MPATATTAPRPRSLAAEQAILNATLQILSEGGYAALTIDKVAATAKASKATIYRRWKNKEHLVLAVFERMPIAEIKPGRSFEAELKAAFKQFAKIMHDSPLRGVMPMLVAECMNSPGLSAALTRLNDRRREPMRQIIQRGIERGELAPDTNVELTIDVIQGAISIRLYFLLGRLSDTWIRELVQLIKTGTGRKRR